MGLAALMAGNTALAQEEGGLRLTFGIEERLESSENAGLSSASTGRLSASTTSLSFGLVSETRTQVLRLGLRGGLRFEDGATAGAPDRFDNPSLDAYYSLTGANSGLVLQATAQRSLLSQASPTAEDPDPQGGGTRTSHSARATLDLGTAGPLGLTLDASHSGAEYSDTAEVDSETLALSATGRLRFAAGGEARLAASQSDYAEDGDALERQTTLFSLGWLQPLSPVLTLDAELGQERVATRERGALTDESEGLAGHLALTMELANGSAGLSFAQAVEPGAMRQTVKLDRTIDMGNQGMTLSLGATRQEADKAALIGSLRYTYDAALGAMSLDVGRSVGSSGVGQEVTTDRIALGLSHDFTARDRFSLNVSAARIDDDAAPDMIDRTDVTASYSRDLGRDWAMNLGAVFTTRQEGSTDSATSKLLFLSISRSFEFRP